MSKCLSFMKNYDTIIMRVLCQKKLYCIKRKNCKGNFIL